jgi:hypothetical protein
MASPERNQQIFQSGSAIHTKFIRQPGGARGT